MQETLASDSKADDTVLETSGTGIEAEDTGEVGADGKITKPFDPTKIRVETKPLTIDLLAARLKEGEIVLDPGFQRKAGIWSNGAQSRLIESTLIRIPLPAFYMDATNEDRWLVVDGLQRLTTLNNFIIKESLELTGLEFLANYDGLTFSHLPRGLQRRILETQVTVYLIEKGTPPEVKFNIFKRINTGGLPLSAQEIRHALNQGSATSILQRLAGSTEFLRATGDGISDDRMADRECVLRFLAFVLTPFEQYRVKDLDTFLNTAMATLNNTAPTERAALEQRFKRAMKQAFSLFGRQAFRKQYRKCVYRYPINKALFESWSVNLDALTDAELQILEQRKEQLRSQFIELLEKNPDFASAISQGTGDIRKVQIRFDGLRQLIRHVLQ